MELDTNEVAASLSQRIRAFLYDYVVIAAYIIVLIGVGVLLNTSYPTAATRVFATPTQSQLVVFLFLTLPVILYFALQESSPGRGTWGKRRVGISVVTVGHRRVGVVRAMWRSVVKFMPWELAHTVIWQMSASENPGEPVYMVGFGLVWLMVAVYAIGALKGPRRITLYDRLSGTRVLQWR